MSTAFVPRWRGPYLIVKGIDNALTLDVYSSASVQQTATVGAITIVRGTVPTAVVTGAAATSLGPPASYTLAAASTSALTIGPDERWDVRWSLTIGGTIYTFRRPAWLTEFDLWPQIIDTDLTDADEEVGGFLVGGGALASFESQRRDAWDFVIWDLYRRGIPAHLITDGGSLVWPHITKTLVKIFRMAGRVDDHYLDKADRYATAYEDAISRPMPIDRDASGAPDEQEIEADKGAWPMSPERPRAW